MSKPLFLTAARTKYRSAPAPRPEVESTPAFKAWFGASKVVDLDGNPLIVYHGAPDTRFVNELETAVFRSKRERLNMMDEAPAHFFAAHSSIARTYADPHRAWDYQNSEPGVIPVYLKLLNPQIIDQKGQQWKGTDTHVKEAYDAGHDGVIIKNSRDAYMPQTGGATDVYVVFSSNQIKHATKNTGKFDAEHPSILASKAAFLQKVAIDYMEMFKPMLALDPGIEAWVKQAVEEAKKLLKKQNRIIWYLRWYRLSAVENLVTTPETEQQVNTLKQKYEREIATKSSQDAVASGVKSITNNQRLSQQLEHLFSLPDPAIQNFEPGYLSPTEVVAQLTKLEDVWKEKSKGVIAPKTEDTVFIDCGDGWAWWLLPRASCDMESKAMGHCGNSPEADRKDRSILSLRQKRKAGNKEEWVVSLTFILHTEGAPDTGTLGEMKGRGNQKPAERYHPAIIKLISDHRIKGMLGGGYLPENNFQFDDLTPEQQQQVRTANPEAYFTIQEYAEAKGLDLEEIAAEMDLTVEDGGNRFVIAEWRDIEELIDERGDEEAKEIAAAVNGYMGPFSQMLAKFDEPSEDIFRIIATMADADGIDSFNPASPTIVKDVIEGFKNAFDYQNSELRKTLELAFLRGVGYRNINTFTELLDVMLNEAEQSEGDGARGKMETNKFGRITYYIDGASVLNYYQTEDKKRIEWWYPYPMGPQVSEYDDFDQEAAMDELLVLDPTNASKKELEARGQGRLFPRPETKQEAERDGIKHSSKAAFLRKALNITQDQDGPDVSQNPKFMAWFGKSKITDSHGRPLKVYHGTKHDFDAFQTALQGTRDFQDPGQFGSAFYFAFQPHVAERYTPDSEDTAKYPESRIPPGANIMPCYLRILKPLILKNAGDFQKMYDKLSGGEEEWSNWESEEQAQAIRAAGYDGVVDVMHGQIAVFNPVQIKSAIGNSGEYSPADNKITASKAAFLKKAGINTERDTAGYDITQNPKFKAWFGKSKVVDAQGRPLVFYHGTTASFDEFIMEAGGSGTLAADAAGVMFFTSRAEVAEDFSGYLWVKTPDGQGAWQKPSHGANIMPVYLKVEKPEIWDMAGGSYEEGWMTKVIKAAKRKGKDSIVFTQMRDGSISTIGPWKQSNVIAVFSPNQIKSAIGNSGEFNPKDNRITASKEGKGMQDVPQKEAAVYHESMDTLTAKVASMNEDQKAGRLQEIADSGDESPDTMLEFAKILFGPDAKRLDDGTVIW